MYNLVDITHHRARVQSFDALHDLSLALLATVLLPVDSGISQLLHHLQQKPPWSLDVLYTADISTCQTQVELTTYIITKIQYHLCESVFVKYLVELHVDLINSPLGHLDLLSELLLHALLLIEWLPEGYREKFVWMTKYNRRTFKNNNQLYTDLYEQCMEKITYLLVEM